MSRFIKLRNVIVDLNEVVWIGADYKQKKLMFTLKNNNTPFIRYKYPVELQYAFNFILSKLKIEETTLEDYINSDKN